MRPYSIRKEENKYIQPVISNASSIQPSPLALLAATCSRIGDTLQEDSTVFTQKNLSYQKGKDITSTKSCVETRPNTLICLDRTLDIQQNSFPPYPPASQSSSPCFKIKHEETYDYNQNCEGIHICPNVIAEARMLETQARVSFNKSCSHETPQSTLCNHNQESVRDFELNSSSCEHAGIQRQIHSSPPAESSCIYQSSPPCISPASNCAVDSYNFQGNVLTHLPPTSNQTASYSNIDHLTRQKQYNPWQSQQQFHRSNSLPTEQKSSCMLHENYEQANMNSQVQTLHNPLDRNYRNNLSHMTNLEQQFPNFRSNQVTPVSQPQQQFFPATPTVNHHPQTFQHYSGFNSPVDIKPDPYTLSQQNLRQATSCIPTVQNFHTQQADMNSIQSGPSVQFSNMGSHPSLKHPAHNHPVGMPASFCSTCNGQQNNMCLPSPGMVGVNPMTAQDVQSQNLAEYQYQQQQMLYARDNRRPRRIACTCPNCRDGENKTVTTKDGKQRKLHVCHIPGCGKIYGKTSHLRAHLRWHAGERPFACNWLFCNKRFTRSDELQRHRRTHTGDKRFECTTCLKKFMRSDHLSKHMKTHQTQNKQNSKEKTDKTNEKGSKITSDIIIKEQI